MQKDCTTCIRKLRCNGMDRRRGMACIDYEETENKGKEKTLPDLPQKIVEEGKTRIAKDNH